jgi:nucleoside-diphosphate-sugar epimerase
LRLLVTGGSGFIGSVLVRELTARGDEVRNFDTQAPKCRDGLWIQGDIRDLDGLTQAASGVDAIIHLAAVHRDDVRPVHKYYDVNVGGAEAVVDAAEKCGIQTIVFTSSVSIYGLNNPHPKEDAIADPFNDYGRSKLQAEDVFHNWQTKSSNRLLVIVRPCVVFGEENRGNVYSLLNQLHSGRFIFIGSGANQKSLAYVRNVAPFLVQSLDLSPGRHLFNYADEPALTTEELVRTACSIMGRKFPARIPYFMGLLGGYFMDCVSNLTGRSLPISSIRVKKFCASTVINTQLIRSTNYQQPYTLSEALRRTIDHDFPR